MIFSRASRPFVRRRSLSMAVILGASRWPAFHERHLLQRILHVAVDIRLLRQEAVIGEFHIIGHQLATVERGLVVPFPTFAQMEDIGRLVRYFPAFRYIE